MVEMNLTAYNQFWYERSRKGKMYLRNDRTVTVDVGDVWSYLIGISIESFYMRLFFTRFTSDQLTDLKANYPEKILQSVLTYSLVRNIPLSIKNVFCDVNVSLLLADLVSTTNEVCPQLEMGDSFDFFHIQTPLGLGLVSKGEPATKMQGPIFFPLNGFGGNKRVRLRNLVNINPNTRFNTRPTTIMTSVWYFFINTGIKRET